MKLEFKNYNSNYDLFIFDDENNQKWIVSGNYVDFADYNFEENLDGLYFDITHKTGISLAAELKEKIKEVVFVVFNEKSSEE